jgi:hypothetical protein
MKIKSLKRSGNSFMPLGRTRNNFMPFLTTYTTNFYHCINISNFEEKQILAIFQTIVEVQPSLTFVFHLAIGGLFEEYVHH